MQQSTLKEQWRLNKKSRNRKENEEKQIWTDLWAAVGGGGLDINFRFWGGGGGRVGTEKYL